MYDGTYKLALELIAIQVEIGQIDKVAELLGQFACKTSKNVSKHTTHVCWDIQLASELIADKDELGQIDEVAELLGQFTCKAWWKCQQNAQTHVCWNIHLASN